MPKAKESERKRRKEINDPDLKAVMHRVAVNLKKTRDKMSLGDVAAGAGINQTTVWEIEKERAFNVEIHTLVTIARALGVKVIDLLK